MMGKLIFKEDKMSVLTTVTVGNWLEEKEEAAYREPNLAVGCLKAFGLGMIDGAIWGLLAVGVVYSIDNIIKRFKK